MQSNFSCKCNDGYYLNINLSTCELCDNSCLTCFGNTASQCLSCTYGFYLNSKNSTCNKCNPFCSNCTSSSNCTNCTEGYIINSNMCVLSLEKCINGYYLNPRTLTCNLCNKACDLCAGPDATNCINCSLGYFNNSLECEICNISCKPCFGPNYYQCISCEHYLLNSICLEQCPVGYIEENNLCKIQNLNRISIQFLFTTIQSVYWDQISNISALTGYNSENIYPNLDNTDPIPAYQRGLYFNGNGSFLQLPYPSNASILFFVEKFFISIWINPNSMNGALIYKVNESNILLSVSLSNLFLNSLIQINSINYIISSNNTLNLYQWNHVLISIDYNQGTIASFIINTMHSPSYNLTVFPFIDSINSTMFIGSALVPLAFFQGFIYSIEAYLELPLINSLASLSCNNCKICPISGICIPDCNITAFYSNISLSCINCSERCGFGCRNEKSCNLCIDENCNACTNYNYPSCINCNEGYEIKNSLCVKCNSTSFSDLISKACQNCSAICISCYSLTNCSKCIDNSALASSGNCECNKGYSFTSYCKRNTFEALLEINSENIVTIIFTESLENILNSSSVEVYLNNDTQEFELNCINNYTYYVNITFNVVNKGDKLKIHFVKTLFSIESSILKTSELEIGLFVIASSSAITASLVQMKNSAKIALIAAASVGCSSSLLNFDLTGIFSFLNVLEIYSYIGLYQIEISSVLNDFLKQLTPNSIVPNVFQYFIGSSGKISLSDKQSAFGYQNNLILINSGSNLTIFCFFLVFLPFILLLQLFKIQRLTETLQKIRNQYKYRYFLRFWLQTCLEYTLNSLIGVLNFAPINIVQFFNLACCILILVINI